MKTRQLKTLSNTAFRYIAQEIIKKAAVATGRPLLLIPSFMEIRLTLRCNLRCRQCEEWKLQAEELSTAFWKKTIKNIYNTIGPYCIRFYGGEPFCRSDLLELLAYCNDLNIITSITTNGTFIDDKTAANLNRLNVSLVNVSLDGYLESTHDYLRGIKGTHQKVIQAIDALKKNNIPVHINTTIMQNNLDEIIDLTKLAQEKKVFITFQGYFTDNYSASEVVHTKKHNASTGKKDKLYVQDRKKSVEILDRLCRLKKTNRFILDPVEYLERLKTYIIDPGLMQKKRCEGMGARLMLHNNGDVNLCSYGGPIGPIGNLQEKSLKNIWSSDKARRKIRLMHKCDCTECLVDRGSCKEGYLTKLKKLYNIFFSQRTG
jgi:MoaA/NifB/PqqE/SkfB family radical SAM enzyme